MNTPAHLIFGAALFGRISRRDTRLAALLGGLAPDLSLYLLGGVSLFVLGLEPEYVFGTLYYSSLWQSIFAVDNSFFVWALLLAIGFWLGIPRVIAFAASGLVHLALDFPLHHDDGRAHFWPLSDWVFASPVSYWDSAHYAGFVVVLESLTVLLAGGYLIYTGSSLSWRIVFSLLIALQLFTLSQWMFYF